MHALAAAFTVGTLLAAAPSGKAPARASEPELKPPAYLSELARGLLRKRMDNHGIDMGELVSAVVALRARDVEALARRIAAEPRIIRPTPSMSDELNRALPPRFFDLQDQLKARAEGLGRAAALGDEAQLAREFGRLTETCVACHSTYLRPPAQPSR